MKRLLIALLTVVAVAVAIPAASPGATATRSCPQSDPGNGLTGLRARGLSCRKAFAVAERTNSVKCFLNGNRCTHSYRGREWTCRLTETGGRSRITCRSGAKVVKYRGG
jgi:hypothetical protein